MQFQRSLVQFIVPVLIAVGCGNKSSAPPAQGSGSGSAPTVPTKPSKDFKEQAEAYAAACKDGCGDRAACHELLLLSVRERGVADGEATVRLGTTLCSQGDKIGCVVDVLVGLEPKEKVGVPDDVGRACVTDHVKGACELMVAGVVNPANADQQNEMLKQGCALGIADACNGLVKTKIASGAIVQQVTARCTDGDPDACDAVGAPIDAQELCRRHDYGACARNGDTNAFNINANGSGGKVQRIKDLAGILPAIVKSCGNNEEAGCKALARFATPNPCK